MVDDGPGREDNRSMRPLLNFILKVLRLPFAKGEMGGRGQVAIFAALIFQVLFVFFAMIVNVGLLVHHKINLQNSVDLAAYYGAMKQAEVLNAIGHANYQIRQSWKLMAFRYRGIGMSGNQKLDAPFNPVTKTLGPSAAIDAPYVCPASFCISYMAFKMMDKDENYCKEMCNGQHITLPGQPFGASLLSGLVMAALPSIAAQVDMVSAIANQKVKEQCRKASNLSWYTLGRFIFAFKNDVANRKRIINRLANSISNDTSDLTDLDGESVKAGVRETLYRNLTYQNQASLGAATGGGDGSFDIYNGLGASGCSGTKDDEGTPPKWLSEIFAKPIYAYHDGVCDGLNNQVDFVIKLLNVIGSQNDPANIAALDASLVDFIHQYSLDPLNFDSAQARLYHTTLGYEKNPWCMAYVRVKATAKPKIPFSPFSGVTLTATSYAKPFGGKIGPWFYKTWPASADASAGGVADQTDPILPPRVRPGEQNVNANDDFLRVDHSRYIGDQVGVKSTMTMGRFGQAIFKKYDPMAGQQIDLLWWNHLLDATADVNSPSSHGDILAWDTTLNVLPDIRKVEIGAIIPDQFDLANYSIEPFWWRAYAIRIQKRSDFSSTHVRGDLGYRKDGPGPLASYSIKDQMAESLPDDAMDYGTLTYFAGRNVDPKDAFTELLTSWHNKAPGDYDLVPARFGKCYQGGALLGGPQETDRAVPGNCIAGGRVGYSVKLEDEQHLIGTQEIGGMGISGKIKNPPPGL